MPGVITGFEPVDVLQGVYMILKQLEEGRAEIEIAYHRGVMPEGNAHAREMVEQVFEPVDADWRGIGVIPGTGLAIREEFAHYDAAQAHPASRRRSPRTSRAASAARCCAASRCPSSASSSDVAAPPSTPSARAWSRPRASCAAYYRFTDYGKA